MKKGRRLSLTMQIGIGLVLGVIVGIVLQQRPQIAADYIRPVGTVYLNLIRMIVVPVVLLSVIQGVISLQDVKKVGTIGVYTLAYYLCTTALAVALGLVLSNLLQVGAGYTLSPGELSYEAVEPPSFVQTLTGIFPSNFLAPMVEANMLQVIVIALLFGFGVLRAGQRGAAVVTFVESAVAVALQVMDLILRLSGIGVFALLCPVIAENGPGVLLPLLRVVAVAYVCYLAHVVVVYGLSVRLFARVGPIAFLKGMVRPILFAFSSASSIGTLPFNLEAVQAMGARREIAGFVLPLGATVNMDGTAIYQGVCAMFVAQIFGVELGFSQQLSIVLTATLASVGTAGVPGAGMIMLAMVLQSAGLPVEGIALVAGMDRILDMGRTVVNITGDAACTLCVDRWVTRRDRKKSH